MQVLVTGSEGQLGKSFQKHQEEYKKMKFTCTDIHNLDITKIESLKSFFSKNKFDYIINCAAYTAVDKAEDDQEMAHLLNVDAPGYLADFAAKQGATFIHISTDFIFGSDKSTPYTEGDLPKPKGVYATTKYLGEKRVFEKSDKSIIIRTSWLYSEFGKNFVKTIMHYARERQVLNVVNDQVGTPTYAGDLAAALLLIMDQKYKPENIEIFHYSNRGETTWFEFAQEIVKLAGISCQINPITTTEFNAPAPRPSYSVLDKNKFINRFNTEIPDWKESLKTCVNILKKEKKD
jgi:dTDP-4-dehydrorhamnose reductase